MSGFSFSYLEGDTASIGISLLLMINPFVLSVAPALLDHPAVEIVMTVLEKLPSVGVRILPVFLLPTDIEVSRL